MIEEIGVIGAGQMGSGIAHVAALSGSSVLVVDISPSQREKAQVVIQKNLHRQRLKNLISAEQEEATLARIRFTDSLVALKTCALVIEAVSENLPLKEAVLRDLSDQVPSSTLIATNTSSLAITRLANAVTHPERFIGVHFMNPVPVMKLVEVICGLNTSPQTYATIAQFIAQIEKTIVVSKDAPGFIVNRILMPMINEAAFAVSEHIATPEDIDTAMILGTNQPMGPLALADLIGLDTCLAIMKVLHEGFGDKYRPSPLLTSYVSAGWLGRKSGRGFYTYTQETSHARSVSL